MLRTWQHNEWLEPFGGAAGSEDQRERSAIDVVAGGAETVQVEQFVKHAEELLDFLKSTGHADAKYKHERNAGRFIDPAVYKALLPEGAGVYLFHFDDGEVFYIGKTEAERGDFARIWGHLGTTAKTFDNGQSGFPRAKFLSQLKPGSTAFEAVRLGHIRIDYLVVEPAKLTSLFEVYLQTMCAFSKEGRLPQCNKRIG